MVILQMFKAELSPTRVESFQEFVAGCPGEYRPLLQPTLALQSKILGRPIEELQTGTPTRADVAAYAAVLSPIVAAEAFTDGTCLYVLVVEQQRERTRPRPQPSESGVSAIEAVPTPQSKNTIKLYFVSPQLDSTRVSAFLSPVNEHFGVELQHTPFESDKFNALKEEGRQSPEPSSPEVTAAARVLADKGARTLAIAIKSSGGLLVGDLARQLPADLRNQADPLRLKLRKNGLVGTEVVVICRKTSAQISRAPSRKVIQKMSSEGVKCACGRDISEERMEEALAISNLGRMLLDGSHWLTILLLEELIQVGVSLDQTLIDQQVGGDEMDCFANISGYLTFFELKDKEFSLGNAYSFGAKIGIYRPHLSVVVTTENVANDARDHFQRAREEDRRRYLYESALLREDQPLVRPIRYIEGIEDMKTQLRDFVSELYAKDAADMLQRVLPFASLKPRAVIDAISKVQEERVSRSPLVSSDGRSEEETWRSSAGGNRRSGRRKRV